MFTVEKRTGARRADRKPKLEPCPLDSSLHKPRKATLPPLACLLGALQVPPIRPRRCNPAKREAGLPLRPGVLPSFVLFRPLSDSFHSCKVFHTNVQSWSAACTLSRRSIKQEDVTRAGTDCYRPHPHIHSPSPMTSFEAGTALTKKTCEDS